MINGCVAQKIKMSRMFIDDMWIPVTLFWAPKMVCIKHTKDDRSGKTVAQFGTCEKRKKLIAKPQRAELEKSDLPMFAIRKEFACMDSISPKQSVSPCELFKKNDKIAITGTTIGRGMTGVMKRHNFGGGNASHGTSKAHRQMGSTGCNTMPSRVFKGKKMPGHYGCEQITCYSKIIATDPTQEIIAIMGSAPGKEGWVRIKLR